MAKKKTRYPKRKGQIIKGSIICLLILAVIAAGVYVWSIFDKQSKSYIMTFDGEKISTDEYQYYLLNTFSLYESMGLLDYLDENSIRTMAFNQLTNFLVIEREAEKRGISLTEEEWASVESYISQFKQSFDNANLPQLNITDERLKELMSGDMLYSKLYDEVTKDYVIDYAAFNAEFAELVQSGEVNIDTKIKQVVTGSREDAEAAREKLLAGTNIDDVIKEYSVLYDEDTPIEDIVLNDSSLSQDIIDELGELKLSDISDVMKLDGTNYAVFKITQTKQGVETERRDTYNREKKDAIFTEAYEQWKEPIVIEPNKKVYNPEAAQTQDESSQTQE